MPAWTASPDTGPVQPDPCRLVGGTDLVEGSLDLGLVDAEHARQNLYQCRLLLRLLRVGWPVRSLSSRRGIAGHGVSGVGMVGALVGLGIAVVSADAVAATPTPAPSTSIPEAIAIAVFVQAGTLLLLCRFRWAAE